MADDPRGIKAIGGWSNGVGDWKSVLDSMDSSYFLTLENVINRIAGAAIGERNYIGSTDHGIPVEYHEDGWHPIIGITSRVWPPQGGIVSSVALPSTNGLPGQAYGGFTATTTLQDGTVLTSTDNEHTTVKAPDGTETMLAFTPADLGLECKSCSSDAPITDTPYNPAPTINPFDSITPLDQPTGDVLFVGSGAGAAQSFMTPESAATPVATTGGDTSLTIGWKIPALLIVAFLVGKYLDIF